MINVKSLLLFYEERATVFASVMTVVHDNFLIGFSLGFPSVLASRID